MGGSVSTRTILCGLLVLTLLLTGCATTDSGTDGAETPTPDGGTSSGQLAPPGLYEQDDGTWQALGLLTYRDLEGGFWAVVGTALPEEADTASVVAVVLPDAEITAQMESLRDKYVSVIGTKSQGADIYQAGPVIEATSIKEVIERTVE